MRRKEENGDRKKIRPDSQHRIFENEKEVSWIIKDSFVKETAYLFIHSITETLL